MMERWLPKKLSKAAGLHKAPALWRQGDVFIVAVPKLPDGETQVMKPVLAEGEVTGHAHRLERAMDAKVISAGGKMYLDVQAEQATVLHEEHGPVTVPHGVYEVRIQREYTPKEILRVVD
jgi:hypothetical protein